MQKPDLSDLERQTAHVTPPRKRELVPVSNDWLSSDAGASLESSKGPWDQFQVNKDKFNVRDTFDMEIYTTPLDENKLSAAQKREAARLARSITSRRERVLEDNLHMRLERGELDEDVEFDEEALHSGVAREEGPPKLREDSSESGGKEILGRDKAPETEGEAEEDQLRRSRARRKLERHRRQFVNRATLEVEFSVGVVRSTATAKPRQEQQIVDVGVEESKGQRPLSQEGSEERVNVEEERPLESGQVSQDEDDDESDDESDDEDEILLLAKTQGIQTAAQRLTKRSEDEKKASQATEQRKRVAETRAKELENAKQSSRVRQLREMTMQNVLSSMNAKSSAQIPTAPTVPAVAQDATEAEEGQALTSEKDIVYFRPALPGAPLIAAPRSARLKTVIEKVAAACCKNPVVERLFKEKAKENASYREDFAFLDADNVFHHFYVFRKQVLRSKE